MRAAGASAAAAYQRDLADPQPNSYKRRASGRRRGKHVQRAREFVSYSEWTDGRSVFAFRGRSPCIVSREICERARWCCPKRAARRLVCRLRSTDSKAHHTAIKEFRIVSTFAAFSLLSRSAKNPPLRMRSFKFTFT